MQSTLSSFGLKTLSEAAVSACLAALFSFASQRGNSIGRENFSNRGVVFRFHSPHARHSVFASMDGDDDPVAVAQTDRRSLPPSCSCLSCHLAAAAPKSSNAPLSASRHRAHSRKIRNTRRRKEQCDCARLRATTAACHWHFGRGSEPQFRKSQNQKFKTNVIQNAVMQICTKMQKSELGTPRSGVPLPLSTV